MTLQDYLRVLREQWIVLVLAVVLGLAGAGAAFLVRPAEYTASLQMYVSAQVGDNPQAAYQGAQLSEQRVKSYTQLLASDRVRLEVAGLIGSEIGPKQITATSALDSVLLNVAVTDPSPSRAAQIVNAIGTAFPGIVDDIERPATPTGTTPVVVRVVEPADIPEAPSSTGLPVTLALGLLAGLAVGVGGALARNALDTTVKSPEDLQQAVGAPNLGFIAYDAGVPKRPLTVHEDPQSPRAEAFRQIRTNLQFVDVDRPPQVIAVTSAMPGEGKTTTLVNLAIAMASTGQRVLVIEADLRRPKVADYLALERAVGLTSVLAGQVLWSHAVQEWGGGLFDVLAAGALPPNPSELLSSRQMDALLAALREIYDVILIDTPPLLPVTDAAAVAPFTDGTVMVCRFGRTTKEQARRAAGALSGVDAQLLGTIMTMVPAKGSQSYAQYSAYQQTPDAYA